MYAVLVADSNINPEGSGDPELVGLFPTFDSAAEWANQEPGWIVQVLPVSYRQNDQRYSIKRRSQRD